jgi:hypothetical protein
LTSGASTVTKRQTFLHCPLRKSGKRRWIGLRKRSYLTSSKKRAGIEAKPQKSSISVTKPFFTKSRTSASNSRRMLAISPSFKVQSRTAHVPLSGFRVQGKIRTEFCGLRTERKTLLAPDIPQSSALSPQSYVFRPDT